MKTEQSCLQLQNRWTSHYAKKKTGNQVLENKISTQIRGRWLFLKLALKVKNFWNNNILQHICGLRETRIWVYRFVFIANSMSWDRFFKIGQSREITRRKIKQNSTRLPWKDVSLHRIHRIISSCDQIRPDLHFKGQKIINK